MIGSVIKQEESLHKIRITEQLPKSIELIKGEETRPVGDEDREWAVANEEMQIAAGLEIGQVVEPDLHEVGAAGLGGSHVRHHLLHRLRHQRHAQQRHSVDMGNRLGLAMVREEGGSSADSFRLRRRKGEKEGGVGGLVAGGVS